MGGLRDEIFAKYRAGYHVHAAMVELTYACPCDCEHCFLVRDPRGELDTAEVLDLLDQLAQQGVINLGLTGGEPFLRGDLPLILERTRKHRFFTSILTTALTVGPEQVELMARCDVRRVEVSLLGSTDEVHDGIMRRPGALHRTLGAVRLMLEAGLDVRLKATVMQKNRHQLRDMHDLAAELGAKFEANVTVAPRKDGSDEPQQLGLFEEQLAAIDPTLISGGLIPDEDFTGGGLLTCQAGRTVIAVNPRGEVTPCLMFPLVVGNIRHNTLQEILHDAPSPALQELRGLTEDDVPECRDCTLRRHCQRCPGIAYMETGDARRPSVSACLIAKGLARNGSGNESRTARGGPED